MYVHINELICCRELSTVLYFLGGALVNGDVKLVFTSLSQRKVLK